MFKIIGENADKLRGSRKFQEWLKSFDERFVGIQEIEEGWSYWKGKEKNALVFALLFIRYLDENNEEKGSVVFYRSDSVAIFLVVTDKDTGKKYVALVEQLRAPSGRKLLEIPAGSVEDEDDFLSTAIKEVREEVGVAVFPRNLIPLGQYYLSPGACNEDMFFYSCEVVLDGTEIQKLQDKLTGTEGENTQVKLYSLEAFEKLLIRDAKTQLAYELYLEREAGRKRGGIA